MNTKTITKEQLESLLIGKIVQVTHPQTKGQHAHSGEVTAIHSFDGVHFDVSFNGHRFGFIPDTIGDDFVEGTLRVLAGDGRRRFTAIGPGKALARQQEIARLTDIVEELRKQLQFAKTGEGCPHGRVRPSQCVDCIQERA